MNDGPIIHNSSDVAPGECINNSNNSITPESVPIKENVTISSEDYTYLARCRKYVERNCKVFKITSGDKDLMLGFVPSSDGRTELATIARYLQRKFKEELDKQC